MSKELNHHYTRDITWKRVTSGRNHRRGLVSGNHRSEETSLRRLAFDDTVRFDRPGNRTPDFHTVSGEFSHNADQPEFKVVRMVLNLWCFVQFYYKKCYFFCFSFVRN